MSAEEMVLSSVLDPMPLVAFTDCDAAVADEGTPATRDVDPAENAPSAKIVIVDDEPINIKAVRKYLTTAGYARFVEISNAAEAFKRIRDEQPDVVLLDIMMPGVSGLEVLRQIRLDETLFDVPVIILTAADQEKTKVEALERGATDILCKPLNSVELVLRVRNALLVKAHHDHLKHYAEKLEQQVRQRTAELAASRRELIHCLGRAAEFRDNETGRHVIRVGRYAGVIARQLGLDAEACELIELAAPLHDVGKIGVPDAILLKPGKLDPQEWEVMQRHTLYGKSTFEPLPHDEWKRLQFHTFVGEQILEATCSPVLTMAGRIALTHHERWDGTGYPIGLAGEDIPLEGRITAVADVFDALSSKRPYKPAFPLDKCYAILEEGRGTQFDPKILDAFFECRPEIIEIRMMYTDLE